MPMTTVLSEVYVKSEDNLEGKLADVCIKDVKKMSAFGELS